MRKIILIVLVLFLFLGCDDNWENGIYMHELSGKNAVVVEKHMSDAYYGYSLYMSVKIGDSVKYVRFVKPELYEAYEVGDTIKFVGMKYE